MRNRKFIDLDEIKAQKLAAMRASVGESGRRKSAILKAGGTIHMPPRDPAFVAPQHRALLAQQYLSLPTWARQGDDADKTAELAIALAAGRAAPGSRLSRRKFMTLMGALGGGAIALPAWAPKAQAGWNPNQKPPNNYAMNVFDYLTPTQQADIVSGTLVDCTTQINNAITQLQTSSAISTGLGGRLFFPPGNYLTNSGISATAGGVYLEGSGMGATFIVNGQTNGAAISLSPGSGSIFGGVSKLSICQSPSVGPTVIGNSGIHIGSNLHRYVINEVSFPNAGTGQYTPYPMYNNMQLDGNTAYISNIRMDCGVNQGILVNGAIDVLLSDIIIYNIGYSTPTSGPNTLLNQFGTGITVGATSSAGAGVSGINCSAVLCAYNGWQLVGYSSTFTAGGNFSACVGDTIGGGGSTGAAEWGVGNYVTLSQTDNCWGSSSAGASGVSTSAVGWKIFGSGTVSNMITGSFCINNESDGFSLVNNGGLPSYLALTGCMAGAEPTFGNGQGGTGYGYNLNGASHISITGGLCVANASGQIGNNTGTSVTITPTTLPS